MKRYCTECEDITHHTQLGLRNTKDICDTCSTINSDVTLTKKESGEIFRGEIVKFIEFDENGKFKAMHDKHQVGFSCIINPQYMNYTWMTTPITEIIEEGWDMQTDILVFKTKNSTYELYILKQ